MADDDLLIERLLRVIDEGRRTATYKLALLMALIDSAALRWRARYPYAGRGRTGAGVVLPADSALRGERWDRAGVAADHDEGLAATSSGTAPSPSR